MSQKRVARVVCNGERVLTSVNTVSIVGVDHEDQTLGVLIVMSPQRSDLILKYTKR